MAGAAPPFPVEAFAELAAMESGHWWFRARNQLLLWVLADKVHPQTDFLEVGCGTGFVLEAVARQFPGLRLEGTEYFDAGLNYARERTPFCSFRAMDATAMDVVAWYHCIGCFDVLEHIADDEKVLANFYAALQSAGKLVLTVPQHAWLWSASDDFAHHVRRYSRSELVAKLRRAGFRVVYVSSFVSFLLPLMALQRLGARRTPPQNFSVRDILAVHPIVNRAFSLVMGMELWLLRLGLTFPAGGSLVLVAQKP